MGELAAVLVHGILRALVDIDAGQAREVAAARRRDRRPLPRDLRRGRRADAADPANVERGTRILFAAHYLERIGDRVTNIAEDVVFLATGEVEDLNP